MLRLLGSSKRFCDGLTRRDLLHVGALAPLGLSIAGWSQASSAAAPVLESGFGKAKRCILLYLWGSPSQLETFDPKPDAPLEIRGEFSSIPTALPGVRVGEILPRIARLLDRVTVLRTLTHPYPIHGTAFAMTACAERPTLTLEGDAARPTHWPFVGSVVDYLAEQADPRPPAVPRNFGLPFPLGSRRRVKPGPFGGFLGGAYDTSLVRFPGEGNARGAARFRGSRRSDQDYRRPLPRYSSHRSLRVGRARRHDHPRSLEWPRRRCSINSIPPAERSTGKRARSRSIGTMHWLDPVLTSGKLRNALDVQREPSKLRERYGMTLFGQSCLAARRLLEAGGKFVTVCWDEYGLVNTGWDTHVHMRSRLEGGTRARVRQRFRIAARRPRRPGNAGRHRDCRDERARPNAAGFRRCRRRPRSLVESVFRAVRRRRVRERPRRRPDRPHRRRRDGYTVLAEGRGRHAFSRAGHRSPRRRFTTASVALIGSAASAACGRSYWLERCRLIPGAHLANHFSMVDVETGRALRVAATVGASGHSHRTSPSPQGSRSPGPSTSRPAATSTRLFVARLE